MSELNRLVVGEETDDDQVVNLSLRPRYLNEFIGQKVLIDNLKVALEAARLRGETVDHILFSGPPGLGKTSLSHIIANEMNARIHVTSGPSITRAGDLIGVLTNLEKGDVVFLDEIHRLSKNVEEFLYPAMESYKIDFVVDKGPYAKTVNFNLKPFTLIGATTRSGLLAAPLRDRFGLHFHLDFYPEQELEVIVEYSARKLDVAISPEAARAVALRSRGTPRIANRLLRRVRDYALVKMRSKDIDVPHVEASMRNLGIDGLGLDDIDRRLIRTVYEHYNGGPVGIETLAATLNEEVDTLVDVIEPYLLKQGLLRRTPRGRELTDISLKHVTGQPR